MSTREKMIAHGRTVEEVAAELGADSLAYISLAGVYEAVRGEPFEAQQRRRRLARQSTVESLRARQFGGRIRVQPGRRGAGERRIVEKNAHGFGRGHDDGLKGENSDLTTAETGREPAYA